MTKKRTIQSFFSNSPDPKRAKISSPAAPWEDAEPVQDLEDADKTKSPPSTHISYPHPIAPLPESLQKALDYAPEADACIINDRPDLDLLCYTPYIPEAIHSKLFTFLRSSLPFYRVKYTIKRGSVETLINTPRFTTVFGIDATSVFDPNIASPSSPGITDARSREPVTPNAYKCHPRPLPSCLTLLQRSVEAATGETFNFCLVNYYASGSDSISYHSDDERFLGERPSIASFSLGATRDFLLRHKDGEKYADPAVRDLKLVLGSGDMVLMRGETQKRWLHSIPKRKGKGSDKGRINITFRKALVKGGTENYYRYNVGDGEVYRWNEQTKEMMALDTK